ncbi:hypothetical protein QUB80_34725 [Chlorogloeopsis sp. ULAP01]|uniref:hypothetical protein n=1 Tax=Chlorogloeopsis sp. ULAP01 TaxID=3056483 RepID=UPI0025AA7A2E|nr:hypothetical protein [Chlorogloeopsis sp. ULAP01]MDM9385810.1 hypothetical protein [Chlorogloeopsis sp. ULAP01]
MAKKAQENTDRDIRVAAISKIWGMTVGILAICIPLSAATRSGPILPLAALTGATVGTLSVWRSDDKKSKANYLSPQKLQYLEQRIANLETIISSDDLDLQRKIKSLESSESADFLRENHKAERL